MLEVDAKADDPVFQKSQRRIGSIDVLVAVHAEAERAIGPGHSDDLPIWSTSNSRRTNLANSALA